MKCVSCLDNVQLNLVELILLIISGLSLVGWSLIHDFYASERSWYVREIELSYLSVSLNTFHETTFIVKVGQRSGLVPQSLTQCLALHVVISMVELLFGDMVTVWILWSFTRHSFKISLINVCYQLSYNNKHIINPSGRSDDGLY